MKSLSENVRLISHTGMILKTELGVKIAAGWDPGDEKDHGTNAGEIVLLTTAGLTNLEALRAAAINGAELLGWQDTLRSLDTV